MILVDHFDDQALIKRIGREWKNTILAAANAVQYCSKLTLISINRSHVTVHGANHWVVVLAFAPRDKFILHNGAENLTEYRFNKREIAHLFCKTCGIQSFSYGQMPDGTKIAAINVNTLKDVKPSELSPTHFDGRSI